MPIHSTRSLPSSVQVGLIQSTPLWSKEPFQLKGCLRSTPRVSSSRRAAHRCLVWVSGYIRITHGAKAHVLESNTVPMASYYETSGWRFFELGLYLSVTTPFSQQWCHEMMLNAEDSNFEKGAWMLDAEDSINIINFVFDIKVQEQCHCARFGYNRLILECKKE
jgi:hypothetical protein